MDWALSSATIPDQSGPGSNGNEGVLRLPQSSSIIGTSPSDCLATYPGYLLGESYPSAEVQWADWASMREREREREREKEVERERERERDYALVCVYTNKINLQFKSCEDFDMGLLWI